MSVRRPANTRLERTAWLEAKPFHTRRLTLRLLREGDAAGFALMIRENNFEFPLYLSGVVGSWAKYATPSPCRRNLFHYFNRRANRFCGGVELGVFRTGNPELMGLACVYHDRLGNPRVTYFLRDKFRGHGYASEAVTALQKAMFAKEGRAYHFAEVQSENRASFNVLRRAGFRILGQGNTINVNPRYAHLRQIRMIKLRG